MLRVGVGYDIHVFEVGRKLVIGGQQLAFSKGLLGHSDADVLTHAVCDALLGAASLGDIGTHFPDTDSRYQNISSLKILEKVAALLKKSGWRVDNVSAVVLLEKPKIASSRGKMSENIAKALGITKSQVGISATTHEGVGAIGRGEAAAAHAVALIQREKRG